MSVESVIGRIGQILAWEQQLAAPVASASALSQASPALGSAAPGGAAAQATSGEGTPIGVAADVGSGASVVQAPAGSGASVVQAPAGSGASFGQLLAGAQAAAPAAPGLTAAGYVNPLAGASVRAERIDQGVDYSGSGTLGAIGPAVVTQVVDSGSGWEGGGYVEYRLTAGPYAGRSIYYAEGVTPTVSVGQTLAPGQPVATIIPGYPTGIELGFAAGQGQSSYAAVYGGGYSEGELTAAGQAFSNLIASLGGPPGLTEGRSVVGHFP